MIVLANKSRTGRAYNLPHDTYCKGDRCACSKSTFPKIVEGQGIQPVVRRVCTSVFVPARGQSDPVESEARSCPEIKADLDRGVLVVIEQRPAEAPPIVEPPKDAVRPSRIRASSKE